MDDEPSGTRCEREGPGDRQGYPLRTQAWFIRIRQHTTQCTLGTSRDVQLSGCEAAEGSWIEVSWAAEANPAAGI
jgi:hypothetical protein